MNSRFALVLLGSVLLLSLACTRVKEPIPDYTRDIFPIEEGQARTYLVIDTTFNTLGPVVDKFFRREVIRGTETDLSGRILHRLETERSAFELGEDYDFQPGRVWSLYRDEETIERTVENNRYLILKFPAYTGVQWNAHLYNGLGTQIYRYQSIDTSLTVNGKLYDPVVFVMHSLPSDTTSIVRFRIAFEAYAPGVGKIMQYDKTIVRDGPQGEFNPDKSYIHIETLVE